MHRCGARAARLGRWGWLLAPALHAAWGAESPAPAPPSNAATVQELPQVTVIGTAPLPGFGLPLNMVPANVQTANSEDLERAQVLGSPTI